MTYSDIRKWLPASQGGCKLFQTCVMWLISSDNWADGTCTMLVITLGCIFRAKTPNVRGKCFHQKWSVYRPLFPLPKHFGAKAKMLIFFFFFNPPEVSFSALRRRRWRLASEVGSSSSRSSGTEKKNKASCGLLTSAHPRPASARCGHFWEQRSTACTNSSTSATRGLRCAADVRFQSSAASMFARAALSG